MRKITKPTVAVTGSHDVDVAFRQHHRAIEEIADHPLIQGQVLTINGSEDITLVNGTVNKLPHKLGRKLKGYLITDLRGATATGRIVRVTSSGGIFADDTKDLWFDVQGHGANITVRVVVL